MQCEGKKCGKGAYFFTSFLVNSMTDKAEGSLAQGAADVITMHDVVRR